MEKPILFFDFDGMQFDTLPAQVQYINNYYGINTTLLEHIGNGNVLDQIVNRHIKGEHIHRDKIYHDYGHNFLTSIEFHKNVLPMEDMCEVINLLSIDYTIYNVTARQKIGINVIQYLLNKYIPNCISGTHCVWDHKRKEGFIGVSKKDFIHSVVGEKIGFFDDSPDEILKTKDLITSYLFDPLNLYSQIEGVFHVQSWKQIGERFL